MTNDVRTTPRASEADRLRAIARRRETQGRHEHAVFLWLMALYFDAKGIR